MKNTTRKYLWVLVANAMLLGVVGGLWQARVTRAEASPASPALEGAFARMQINAVPARLKPVSYLAGLSERATLPVVGRGWTILNLWASWCAPCLMELPSLQAMADAYAGKGVRVVAVSVDRAGGVRALEESMERHEIAALAVARNWDDRGEVSGRFSPPALPATYIIDPRGRVYATFEGAANWASPEAFAFADSLAAGLKASRSGPARR